MPSAFSQKSFNHEIDKLMDTILTKIKQPSAWDRSLLDSLFLKFIDYYEIEQHSTSRAQIDAKVTFSMFLQYLIYYVSQVNLPQDHQHQLIISLTQNALFHYPFTHGAPKKSMAIWYNDKSGETLLTHLCRSGQNHVIRHALESLAQICGSQQCPAFIHYLTQVNRYGYSPLQVACQYSQAETMKMLLLMSRNASVNDRNLLKQNLTHQNYQGRTVLHIVCEQDSTTVFRLLEKETLSVFASNTHELITFLTQLDRSGFSALDIACLKGHGHMVEWLLNTLEQVYGGKPSPDLIQHLTRTDVKVSPLLLAIGSGNERSVAALLTSAHKAFSKQGAFLAFQSFLMSSDQEHNSPLNYACARGNNHLVRGLIQEAAFAFGGKDTTGFQNFLTHRGHNRFSPLNNAVSAGHDTTVDLLLQEARLAYGGRNTAGFRAFLEHTTKARCSCLDTAAYRGYDSIVTSLLEAADKAYSTHPKDFDRFINHPNQAGYTPLTSACLQAKEAHRHRDDREKVYRAIAQVLLERGANPDLKNNHQLNAKSLAPESWSFIQSQHAARSTPSRAESEQERYPRKDRNQQDTHRYRSRSPAPDKRYSRHDSDERETAWHNHSEHHYASLSTSGPYHHHHQASYQLEMPPTPMKYHSSQEDSRGQPMPLQPPVAQTIQPAARYSQPSMSPPATYFPTGHDSTLTAWNNDSYDYYAQASASASVPSYDFTSNQREQRPPMNYAKLGDNTAPFAYPSFNFAPRPPQANYDAPAPSLSAPYSSHVVPPSWIESPPQAQLATSASTQISHQASSTAHSSASVHLSLLGQYPHAQYIMNPSSRVATQPFYSQQESSRATVVPPVAATAISNASTAHPYPAKRRAEDATDNAFQPFLKSMKYH